MSTKALSYFQLLDRKDALRNDFQLLESRMKDKTHPTVEEKKEMWRIMNNVKEVNREIDLFIIQNTKNPIARLFVRLKLWNINRRIK